MKIMKLILVVHVKFAQEDTEEKIEVRENQKYWETKKQLKRMFK